MLDDATTKALERLERQDRVLLRLRQVLEASFGPVEMRLLGENETWEQAREQALRRRMQSLWSSPSQTPSRAPRFRR